MLIDTMKFEYIRTIAEERNLTKAADKLFITQPALTIFLNKLEDELGVKLFDRTVNPITITACGEKYISSLSHIMSIRENLLHEMKELSDKEYRHLSIGIGSNRGRFWLPLIVPAFQKEYPMADMEIKEGTDIAIEHTISAKQLDIAITTLPIISSDISYQVLCEEKILLLLSKNDPLFQGKTIPGNDPDHPYLLKSSDLSGKKLITVSEGHGLYKITQRFLNYYKLKPSSTLMLSNSETACHLAANGIGYTFTLYKYCRDLDLNLFSPVFCTLQDPVYSRSVVAAYSSSKKLRDIEQCFIDVTKKAILKDLARFE